MLPGEGMEAREIKATVAVTGDLMVMVEWVDPGGQVGQEDLEETEDQADQANLPDDLEVPARLGGLMDPRTTPPLIMVRLLLLHLLLLRHLTTVERF